MFLHWGSSLIVKFKKFLALVWFNGTKMFVSSSWCMSVSSESDGEVGIFLGFTSNSTDGTAYADLFIIFVISSAFFTSG